MAERVPNRLAHIVNLDGMIAEDGKAFKDLLPDYWEDFRQRGRAAGNEWWAPPVLEWAFGVTGADLEWMQSKLTPHPLKTWEPPLHFTNPAARSIPRTFIACTDNPLSDEELAAEEKRHADLGWGYRAIPAGHDVMITAPEALTSILLDLV